jgi:hypothetical protein
MTDHRELGVAYDAARDDEIDIGVAYQLICNIEGIGDDGQAFLMIEEASNFLRGGA